MQSVFAYHSFRFILDRPHAKEHLSNAGEALESLGLESLRKAKAQDWAAKAIKKLENGQVLDVVDELHNNWVASGKTHKKRNDTLRLEANYFEHKRAAVAYAEYRNNGWSTASSEVESGHRHVVQSRLKISGAWWHPDNVDNMLALRVFRANGWWDEYWQAQDTAWKERTRPRREQPQQAA